MTETDTPTPIPADVERRHAERRRGEQRRLERALWQGALGLLLGLVAIAAAIVVGFRLLAFERSLEAERTIAQLAGRDHEVQQAALAGLAARAQATDASLARLEALAPRLEALDGRMAQIEARIEAPQRAVARSEAAALVDLGLERLTLAHDVRGATSLYEAAAARLAGASDPGTLHIRAQLERDLAALRAVAAPDVAAIGARLAAAEAAARNLPMLGAIQGQYAPPGAAPAPPPGLGRAWWRFTTALSDLVSVRRVSDASVRLVSMEEIGVRRHHLETLLFAARFAALRGDEAEYAATVGAARDWLGRFFDGRDGTVRAVDAELGALAGSRVAVELPEVTGSQRLLRGKAP
ncbi:MAG: uroporphyrinogen-III C-methyltransferase [Proteobacteria bacterium]|nr:uroporphyrinogen-III C-methyltransferase [Pseudomonadota bacterium]